MQPGPTRSSEQAAQVPEASSSLRPELLDRRRNVLLGVTGSVATIKMNQLASLIHEFANVKIVATKAARHFFSDSEEWGGQADGDEDDWREWNRPGDDIMHIELRRWADVFVIAPLSANTLAKIASGMCDNLLTCVVRAWDYGKPLLVAPAMNTFMWENSFTNRHLQELQQTLAVQVIPPVVKKLACGDVGDGAMAPVQEIASAVRKHIEALDSVARV